MNKDPKWDRYPYAQAAQILWTDLSLRVPNATKSLNRKITWKEKKLHLLWLEKKIWVYLQKIVQRVFIWKIKFWKSEARAKFWSNKFFLFSSRAKILFNFCFFVKSYSFFSLTCNFSKQYLTKSETCRSTTEFDFSLKLFPANVCYKKVVASRDGHHTSFFEKLIIFILL